MRHPPFSATDSPQRILHLIHGLSHGGIETWLLSTLRRIPRHVFALDVCCKGSCDGVLAPYVRETGARLFQCPLRPTVLPFVRHLATILRRDQYSLLHVHTQAHCGPAVYAARTVGVPTVVTFHSTEQPPQTPFTRLLGVRNARAIYARRSIRYALRNSTIATGVSRAVAQAVKNSVGLPQSRCEALYLGAPRPPQPSAERLAEYRKALQLLPNTRVIIHVGSFRAAKNHAAILQVFRHVVDATPNVALLLVGDGPLRPAVQNQACRLGLDRHVRLLGTRRDATALMQVADVLLFPSLREGLSVALMEASAVGLPIVGSDIPGNREATDDGAAARLHNVADIEGMAASVIELLNNSSGRRCLADRGRAIYERIFSIEAAVERLMSLYERVLQAHDRQAAGYPVAV